MKFGNLPAYVAGIMLACATSTGAVTYATDVISVVAGIGAGTAGRDDPLAVLGAEDDAFYSLGLGGEVTLGFGTSFTGPGTVWEVTFGNAAAYAEAIEIAVGVNSVFTDVGIATNIAANGIPGASFAFDGVFDQVRITDVTESEFPTSTSIDGFDLNAVAVTERFSAVPVPASVLMLGAALVGLVAIRRIST